MDSIAETVVGLSGVADRVGGWALALVIIVVLLRAIYVLYQDGRQRDREFGEALAALSSSFRDLREAVEIWLRGRP